ncbi:MAG TPA: sigma-70 family RNA polymerase sigma factor [Saprospiraceae bacterium]|nr:sigma-70 family RNA polymerase sigma factor [Saprospiraceae bacterium]
MRNRDQRGLSVLYEQYSDALFGIILRTVGDKGHAEDILQQTFVKIWNAIDQYDEGRGALFTWMSTIARNLALDMRRLKSFEVRAKTDDVQTIVYSSNTISNPAGSEAIDTARLLATMDEKYRIVLEMMYLQGYTQAEIAEKLDMPLGTVKTRVKKAIDILREALQDEKSLFIGGVSILVLIGLYKSIMEIFAQ